MVTWVDTLRQVLTLDSRVAALADTVDGLSGKVAGLAEKHGERLRDHGERLARLEGMISVARLPPGGVLRVSAAEDADRS